jgi:hypothetical protein
MLIHTADLFGVYVYHLPKRSRRIASYSRSSWAKQHSTSAGAFYSLSQAKNQVVFSRSKARRDCPLEQRSDLPDSIRLWMQAKGTWQAKGT